MGIRLLWYFNCCWCMFGFCKNQCMFLVAEELGVFITIVCLQIGWCSKVIGIEGCQHCLVDSLMQKLEVVHQHNFSEQCYDFKNIQNPYPPMTLIWELHYKVSENIQVSQSLLVVCCYQMSNLVYPGSHNLDNYPKPSFHPAHSHFHKPV